MKTFKSIIGVSLALIMIIGLFAIVPLKSSAATVTDTLTRATTGVADGSTTYADWNGKSGGDSTAVYAGQSAGGSNSIQIRSKNSNSGVVTTTSGGTISEIKITFASVSQGKGPVKVYGKNSSYSSASDLFGSNAGTEIDSFTPSSGTVKTISVSSSYTNFGICSTNGAFYISEIEIKWETSSGGGTPEPTTVAPATAEPTTAAPTTAEPTTAAPTTAEPTTEASTSLGGVVDTLTAGDFDATSTSYKDFSGVSKTSDAVYAGKNSNNNGNIQLKSNDKDTGIVSTTTGGKVKSVKINVANGSNTVNVYGSNTAYTSASDLFNSNKQGTLVGSVTTTGTVTFNNDYAYVGICSASGAVYLSSVEITWDDGSASQETTQSTSETSTSATGETKVDTLNAAFTGNPSSYTAWSNTGASGAVYAGQSSGDGAYIQIRKQSPSGIVTTTSYGRAVKIEVAWDYYNTDGRILSIYGDNTAYTSPSQLYGSSPKGTLLGSMTFDGTGLEYNEDFITEFDITGNYKYIGICANGAAYLKSIKITWEVYETPTEPEPTTIPEEPTTEEPTEATTEAPTETPTDPIVNTYTVRWLDYDGTELASENYTEGETPVYPNSNPETYYDDTYRYTFTGWSPAISAVTGNTDYTAVYSSEPLSFYTVTWNNYDGTELDHRDYPEGKVPKYYGELPYKPDDGDYRYVFSGWTPALEVIVDHNVTYTAMFTRVEKTSSILPMDTDVVSKMENSYYLYDGELLVLGEINGFTVDGDKLMLGNSVVADVEESDTQRLGNTVYVKGIGTSDKPYEFYPNYIYGKSTGDISGYQDRIDVEDCKPGDGFVGYSKVYVGDSLVSFMADSAVNATTSNGFIGVGKDNYGYRYINQNAVEYNGHGPYEFDNDEHILYYGGVNDSNAYVFSTVSPEYIAEYYRRFSEKEADIFEKGRIEYFLDDDDYIYSYSNGVFTRISQEETEITELINQVVTPSDSDVIFQNNTNLLNQYFGGRLLGFQKKLTNLDIEEDKSDSLRFMTVLSSKVLKKLYNNNNADFGYVFAAVEGDRVNEINIEKLTVNNGNKYSCKNTTNKLSGIFGNKDFDSTDYKYLTAGIDDIPAGYTLAVRFYITYKGETHYINYPARDTSGIVFNSSQFVS